MWIYGATLLRAPLDKMFLYCSLGRIFLELTTSTLFQGEDNRTGIKRKKKMELGFQAMWKSSIPASLQMSSSQPETASECILTGVK